jgi:hypothetical protein
LGIALDAGYRAIFAAIGRHVTSRAESVAVPTRPGRRVKENLTSTASGNGSRHFHSADRLHCQNDLAAHRSEQADVLRTDRSRFRHVTADQNAGDRRVARNDGEDDEAGDPRKGCDEIGREARCNFRVAGVLNLQIRPAPDRLCEQVSRGADIYFQVTRLRFCDVAAPQARMDSRRARFAQQQNGAGKPESGMQTLEWLLAGFPTALS